MCAIATKTRTSTSRFVDARWRPLGGARRRATTAPAYMCSMFKVILSTPMFPLPTVQPAELLTDLQKTQNV